MAGGMPFASEKDWLSYSSTHVYTNGDGKYTEDLNAEITIEDFVASVRDGVVWYMR